MIFDQIRMRNLITTIMQMLQIITGELEDCEVNHEYSKKIITTEIKVKGWDCVNFDTKFNTNSGTDMLNIKH